MKKLALCLLTLISFSNAFAMEQPSHPNAQDQEGNTPLHHAVTGWQTSNNAIQASAQEYDSLRAQYQQITKKINEEQPENLEELKAQRKTLFEKAKTTKDVHTSDKQKAAAHLKTARLLIENGSFINTPNNNHKTAEQLSPDLINKLVYDHLWNALHRQDIPTIKKLLGIGANPNFTNEYKVTALQSSVVGMKPESVKELLLSGARLNAIEPFTKGNVLHVAAKFKVRDMITILLESPQGSPVCQLATITRLAICQERMKAFLSGMDHKGSTIPSLPLELQQKIYAYTLPDAQELINLVPLAQLPRYKKYLGEKSLVNALVARHMDLVGKAITKRDWQDLLPHMYARNPEFAALMPGMPFGIMGLDPENETSKMLDPEGKPLEQHKEAIKANYQKLLE